MSCIIADVVFQSDQRLLQKGEHKRHLEPKVFSLLTTLIAANGKIVSREQLIVEVWNNRVVGEGAINRTISLLRGHFSALTDVDIVETVPTQGYRLVAPVLENQVESTSAVKPEKSSASRAPTKLASVITTFATIIFAFVIYALYQPAPSPALKLISGPLIGLTGLEYKISASRDGKFVLFHHLSEDDEQSVIIYNTATHLQKTILNNALAVLNPSGDKVAYVKDEPKCVISIYDLTSKKPQELFDCEYFPSAMAWSNEHIYFNARLSKSHPYQIFKLNDKTKHLQQLTNPSSDNNTRGDFRFAINPDSGYLAVLRYINGSETKVLIFDQHSELKAFHIDKGLKNIVWHPNNKDLVVTEDKAVYRLSSTNGELNALQQINSSINSLAVIEQNNEPSLLISNAIVRSDIQLFDIATEQNKTWQQSGGTELLPRMQADTKLVLSARFKNHRWWQIKNSQASLVDTSLPYDLKFERYEISPDGKRLILSKLGAIYEVDINTGKHEEILDESHSAYVVNYNDKDDHSIIYSSNKTGQWQLWSYHRTQNQHLQLTSAGGYSGKVWNGYLYYSKFASDGLWRKKLNSAEETLIIKDFDRINWLNWQIRKNHLYFYKPNEGIWQYNLVSHKTKQVMQTDNRFIHQYTVSEDQNSIYWVRRSSTEGDVYQYSFGI